MNTPNDRDPDPQTPKPTRPPTPEDPTVEVPSSPGSQYAVPRSDTAAPPRSDPKSIGPYRVIRRLGHGGMGVVYLAQREDGPIRRPVAVKVMRAGLEATEVAQRFERERQVLAALDHPNIARLLDAGSTADEQPYFVMEFVEGQSLDQYCDERRLTVAERLKIFRQVCAAVHHAHQNLVVHRDIKPRNILVTADGTPKLLDFGIAKLLNVSMAPAMDLHTETGVRLMTPEYASPEQVRGQSVTTAADVYSLGVVLFELLTGHRPFRLKTRLMQEVERVICEENPERPSTMITRVERLGDETQEVGWSGSITPEEVSKARGAGITRLRRALAGDLDNIVLMAMRKEPHRRYRSAEQFAEDIQRHLEGHPVIARPDTAGYRMAKFVARHRGAVAAAAAIVVVLIAGIVTSSWFAAKAERERRAAVAAEARAVQRFGEVRSLAKVFLFDLYDNVNRLEGSLPARQMMAEEGLRYLDSLAAEASDDPGLQSEVASGYQRLGEIQSGLRSGNLGDVGAAAKHYAKARSMREALVAADPTDPVRQQQLAMTLVSIGDLERSQGRMDEALALYDQATRIVESVPVDDASQIRLAAALLATSDALVAAGRFDEAQPLVKRSNAIRREVVKNNADNADAKRLLAVGLTREGFLAKVMGDTGTALDRYAENQRIRRELAAADSDSARFRRDLMTADLLIGDLRRSLGSPGDLEAAMVDLTAAADLAQQLADADPTDWRARIDLADCRTWRGVTLLALDRHDEAVRELQEACTQADAARSANPANVRAGRTSAKAHETLADAQAERDQAMAADALSRAVAIWRSIGENDPSVTPDVARCQANLGLILLAQGRSGEGRAMLQSADQQFAALSANGPLGDQQLQLHEKVKSALKGG